MRASTKWKIAGLNVLLLAVILGIWSYATGPGGVNRVILPPPGEVWRQLVELIQTRAMWSNIGLTLVEILTAFIIAATAGFAVGFIFSRTPLRARVVEPLVAWGYLAPTVLFYPLLILWIGTGPESKVAYAAVSGFFPIAFNSLRGFQAIDQRYLRVARAFGASKAQTDWLVKVQAALPMVMSGVRIGAALTIIGVILAEMLSAQRGIGYQLAEASHTLQGPRAFATIIIIISMVAVLQLIIQRLGRAPHQE